jgi:hypothetical protein
LSFNYKTVLWLIALAIVLSIVGLFVADASAISSDTEPTPTPFFVNYTPVSQTELTNHTYVIHRIQQGDKVYLGDHIDISGVVAGNKALVWFRGGEPDPSEQPYVIPLPDTKAGYYDFYVDPAIFSQMTGDIWKWNGYVESNGNMHAFYIVARYRTTTLTFPNGTSIDTNTTATGPYNVTPSPKEPILPAKRVADYLTVHEQGITIQTNGKSKLWVLGRKDGIYDQISHDNQSISEYQIGNLESGTYQLLIQYPGKDGFEVFYNNETEQLYTHLADQPPWIVDNPVSLYGLTPVIAGDKIKEAIGKTTNTYDIQSLVVQEPLIQLVSMEFVSVYKAKDYYKNTNLRGDVTLYDVKGYTNVQTGTNLYFALDETKQTGKIKWYNATAQGEYLGDMRTFEAFIPVYWDEMKEGMHTVSGYTDVGGSIFRDFPIRVSQNTDSPVPVPTVMWVDNRNPWVPTPTPEIIKQVVTQVVVQTITIPVTPSNEQVYEQQLAAVKANSKQQYDDALRLIPWIISGIVGLILVIYVVSVVARAYERRKENLVQEKKE